MLRPGEKRVSPLVGLSSRAAAMVWSLEYDSRIIALSGDTIGSDYSLLVGSRMDLIEYISRLEQMTGIQPNTYYRRD